MATIRSHHRRRQSWPSACWPCNPGPRRAADESARRGSRRSMPGAGSFAPRRGSHRPRAAPSCPANCSWSSAPASLASSCGGRARRRRSRLAAPAGERCGRRGPGRRPGQPSTRTTGQLAARFTADPSVAGVSPNYLRYIDARCRRSAGCRGQWGLEDVRAGDAWRPRRARRRRHREHRHRRRPTPRPGRQHVAQPRRDPGNGIDDDGNGYVDDVYGIDAVNGDSDPYDDATARTRPAPPPRPATTASASPAWLEHAGHGAQVPQLRGGGSDAGAITCIDYVVREKLITGSTWWPSTPPGAAGRRTPLRDAINAAGADRLLRGGRQRRRGQRRQPALSLQPRLTALVSSWRRS